MHHLWHKVFTTDQRVSLWNRLEIPSTYLQVMVENQESEHQEIESQERLHIQDQMKQITGSKEQIVQFIDLILAPISKIKNATNPPI